jgi:glycosyltransferase involved in cell wall biosynthesis
VQKIVHLSTVHPAHDVRIALKESAALAGAGYSVVLLAPAANRAMPGGVCGVPLRPVGSRLRRATLGQLRAGLAALHERAAAYHFHDPELIPLGLLLKLLGRRVIYDVHEDLPRQLRVKTWLPAPLRCALAPLVDGLERGAALCFDGVVAATDTIAERFPRNKTVVVRNLVNLDEFPEPADGFGAERPPIAAYIGGISIARGLEQMLAAVDGVQQEVQAKLVLAGPVQGDVAEKALADADPEQVEYRGQLDRTGVRALLSEARVGLVLLHPVPSYMESLPVKLFEYMAAGLPIIASDFPAWRQLLKDVDCVRWVDPHDAEAVARELAWLFTHPAEADAMGRRGRQAVEERYNWQQEKAVLLNFYRDLLADQPD